jgi:uncharacterized protein
LKIQIDSADPNVNVIRSYGPGQVKIRDGLYHASLIVTPTKIISDWPPQSFSDLDASHFEALVALEPELVVLGTGKYLRFPAPAVTRALIDANVGLEVMDTGAACRTYNILMSEGRKVVVALLPIESSP